jgi:5-methylcytosine-specific restriction enzyme subunit McrC
MSLIYKSSEHNYDKKHKCLPVDIERFNACYYDDNGSKLDKPYLTYLGLREEEIFDVSEKKCTKVLRANYFIGYRWTDEKYENYIYVAAKEDKDTKYKANYLEMFLTCMNDPIVSKKMENTYKIFFDEPWIKTQENENYITPLIVLHFLHTIKKISCKGLKKGYVKVTTNLTSKVKGRILINQTIKKNHFKNRPDKTVCSHQVFTINCIENKIIKTALVQCGKHLSDIGQNETISKLLKQNLNVFELVDTEEVFESDFSKIRHSPFYKEYKEALRLAKMIFKRFGFTLNGDNGDKVYKTPPFYIDMPELFERFVEVKLRREPQYQYDLIPGYSQDNGTSYRWGLRPDFVVKNKKTIIDAKYKYWIESCNGCHKQKDDFQQLSLYGRDNEIREVIGLEDNEEAKLIFIFPTFKETDDSFIMKDALRDFSNIINIGLTIPRIKDK